MKKPVPVTAFAVVPLNSGAITMEIRSGDKISEFTVTKKDLKRIRAVIKEFKKECKRAKKNNEDPSGIAWDYSEEK